MGRPSAARGGCPGGGSGRSCSPPAAQGVGSSSWAWWWRRWCRGSGSAGRGGRSTVPSPTRPAPRGAPAARPGRRTACRGRAGATDRSGSPATLDEALAGLDRAAGTPARQGARMAAKARPDNPAPGTRGGRDRDAAPRRAGAGARERRSRRRRGGRVRTRCPCWPGCSSTHRRRSATRPSRPSPG